MKSNTYGAVVGRFQIDALHAGHIGLLRAVAQKHERLIVVLGVPRTPLNATNPLSFECREVMLRDQLKVLRIDNVTIVRQTDERSDVVWSKKLDMILDAITGGDVTLYVGRDGFKGHYTGKFEVKELPLGKPEISASRHRQKIVSSPEFSNRAFRAGQIYAMGTKHFQTYTTVDMALLFHNGNSLEMLLCRKPNETAWRFPGGFVDEEKNETFAQAAAREMMEETGLVSETGWTIVRDYPIPNEWRLRNNLGVSHRTILLYGMSATKGGKAQDDIAEVQWFDLDYVINNVQDIIVEEHRMMMIGDVFNRLKGLQLTPRKEYAQPVF